MKVLIINTAKDQSGLVTGVDDAMTMELYRKYRCNSHPCHLHITANHIWSKYTFIDEKNEYIGTFNTMEDLLKKNPFLGNCLTLTHEQWLDKQNADWKTKY